MPRYPRGHIRKYKEVNCTRKEHKCHCCGGIIPIGSKAYARNPHFLGHSLEYEHRPNCPKTDGEK